MTESDAPELGRFLTIPDTAELLNVSVKQVYALVHSGELPAIQLGRQGLWRVERTVLDAYIASKYEETRLAALWRQSAYADLPELFA